MSFGSKPSLWAKRAFIAAMVVAAATYVLRGHKAVKV